MNSAAQNKDLEQWRLLYADQVALVKDPQAQQRLLIELAYTLHAQGVVNAGELVDLLEQADAAYAWGVEEGEQA